MTFDPAQVLDWRHRALIPKGKCIYIQSGDPGDFDGYLIGVAGHVLESHTKDMMFALVVPERRACPDRNETDVNAHDEMFSESVLRVSGSLFRALCPKACIIRGPLNQRNIIPLKFIFSEPDMYGDLVESQPPNAGPISWRSVVDLADMVQRKDVTSVVIDMNGSMGYLKLLSSLAPSLGSKLKASGVPIVIMAGVLAEQETGTLRVPGRDPRSTMNAIYHPEAVQLLLDMAKKEGVSLLFVTNNVCNHLFRFEDSEDIIKELELKGLMKDLATQWYGPHLKGKCVPFDWVSFTSMLLYKRFPSLLRTEKRHLWVGKNDASILVLDIADPNRPMTPTITANLQGTQLWGVVDSVISVDRSTMLKLARSLANEMEQM